MAVPGIVWLEVMDFCCVCICENTLNQINMAVVRSDWSVNRFVLWHGLHMVWEAQSSCVINASKLPPEPLLDPPYPPTPLTLALHPFNPSPPPFFLMQYSWQGWPKWQRINIYIFSSGRLAGTSTWKKKNQIRLIIWFWLSGAGMGIWNIDFKTNDEQEQNSGSLRVWTSAWVNVCVQCSIFFELQVPCWKFGYCRWGSIVSYDW